MPSLTTTARAVAAALAFTLLAASPARAAGDCPSCGASAVLSLAGGLSVAGSASLLAHSGKLVVEAVEHGAAGTILVLREASGAGTVSVRVGREALAGVSLAAGSTIEAVAQASGCLLVASGKALAFVPNEAGASLLHQSRHGVAQ